MSLTTESGPPQKPEPSPEELAKRRAIAKTQNRMERISQYANSALPAFLNNPDFWTQASKSLGGSHELFARLAWDQGLAMEQRGQEVFKALLSVELAPPANGKEQADAKSRIIVP